MEEFEGILLAIHYALQARQDAAPKERVTHVR